MPSVKPPRARTYAMTVVAQDPEFQIDGKIVTTKLNVPSEQLTPGPGGARIKVIDYDASTRTLYKPFGDCIDPATGEFRNCLGDAPSDDTILTNPWFHGQNVYAIAMSTLARFEKALGRRLSWGYGGHQLYIAPHAFCEANAFYSEQDWALLFGYFPHPDISGRTIFTCLSFDVVVHETTHALLDGLRNRFTEPSSLAQDGFHEGYADIVALLSVLASKDMVEAIMRKSGAGGARMRIDTLQPSEFTNSALVTLAEELGKATAPNFRDSPLRASRHIRLDTSWRRDPAFNEPHRHGELLVAALLNTFVQVWYERMTKLAEGLGLGVCDEVSIGLLAEEGATAAESLLTVLIRAVDYTPPTHITYEDFLSALLTADQQVVPDDSKYQYRRKLRDSFAALGIEPASNQDGAGTWRPCGEDLKYDRARFESMLRDREEMYRFIWDNRRELKLAENAYTRIESVRPVARTTPDGFFVHETVAEYTQRASIQACRLVKLGIDQPAGLSEQQRVTLWGGGTLIFDEYGRVKYHVRNRVFSARSQERRLKYQVECGYFAEEAAIAAGFGRRHMARMLGTAAFRGRLATF
jgi:hypothetical protein